MAGFSKSTPIVNGTKTANFNSDPPYELGWAATASVNLYLNNWGNTDNQLVIDVYWGALTKGLFPKHDNINWVIDPILSGYTFNGSAGTTTVVAGDIDIPKVKGRFMKLVGTLTGTSKTVDIVAWFHGKDTGSGNQQVITGIGNKKLSLGQQTSANSVPIVIASDQTAVPVSGTITANAGTNLNTSTLAIETGGNLATIATRTPALGSAASASSSPVVIASDQAVIPVNGNLTNNNAAPAATQVGVIAALANASSPSFTEGKQTLLSVNLAGNMRTTLNQISGNVTLVGNGVTGNGSQRVTIASDNTPINVNAGLMPSGTTLNTYSVHITSNATTIPTSSTAYISSIVISNEVGGTTSTITIQDGQGTPLKLVNGLATTAVTTAPTVIDFQTPVKMVTGINIITSGAVAATVDVWINYYQ